MLKLIRVNAILEFIYNLDIKRFHLQIFIGLQVW